jgi:ATPase family associated with various cellular activities (AAA)
MPFQGEVAVLARGGAPTPSPATAKIQLQVEHLYSELIRRTGATLARGLALPLVDLADEHGLDPAEVRVLLAVAAPALCPDIARLYTIAANNPNRPCCDRALVRTLLGHELGEARLAQLLAPTSTLVRLGLVELSPAANWQFDALTIRPSLLFRLLGEPRAAVAGELVTVRPAAIELERFRGPRDELRRWLAALEELPQGSRNVRVVVRGPAASGRRTLLDAVAARAQRSWGFIDATQLAALGAGAIAGLRGAIRDAAIAGVLPCVVDPEALTTDAGATAAVREILRAHPGPLAIVARPGAPLPVEPGACSITLPAATAGERLAAWSDAAGRFGLVARDLVTVATRLPAGMATIEHVCRETAVALGGSDRDCSSELDARCRQQLEHKLGKLATRVVRKASRDELILPRELREAIEELIAGVRLRHVVYDGWGFGHRSSLRGLTALFYGPPGTGKSMVAGMIANELGLELYRVDLSAVTSKWLGETEKHLAELFDAAEGGEIVLLFDEADALFAKRTEVESSHDRYANLGTSYLLQRLDDFGGIALLTSNSESSIDDAFKRRLSFRLQFPFPEADMRAQLWAAHLPAGVPRAPDLDFGQLAERFQLSGGNIRNCLLRAAFLAAREGAALDQRLLVRTVESEYREMGHISTTGRLI